MGPLQKKEYGVKGCRKRNIGHRRVWERVNGAEDVEWREAEVVEGRERGDSLRGCGKKNVGKRVWEVGMVQEQSLVKMDYSYLQLSLSSCKHSHLIHLLRHFFGQFYDRVSLFHVLFSEFMKRLGCILWSK